MCLIRYCHVVYHIAKIHLNIVSANQKRHLITVLILFNDAIISCYMRKNYICIHDYNIIIYGFKSKRPYQAKRHDNATIC